MRLEHKSREVFCNTYVIVVGLAEMRAAGIGKTEATYCEIRIDRIFTDAFESGFVIAVKRWRHIPLIQTVDIFQTIPEGCETLSR
ncbi:MAG TPA: hypothetical protein VF845_13700 [Terriglobales bacterium]